MKKKLVCLLLVMVLTLGMLPLAAQAADSVTTARVTIRSQMANGYLHGFAEPVEVTSDLAEQYGFPDQVEGVSALDALVKSHMLEFGADFSPETAETFLVVSGSGMVSKLFGVETMANGFFRNQGYPNDGTESPYGGYNGTTVTTQKLETGDTVDFFCYQDTSYYSDYYSWVGQEPNPDGTITVTVKGVMAMMGYLYNTPEAMLAAAAPLAEVGLGWVDPQTGAVTPIAGLLTDEQGQAVVTPQEGCQLVALSDEDWTYVIMNPAVPPEVTAPEKSVVFHVTPQDAVVKVYAPDGTELSAAEDGSYTGAFAEAEYFYTVTKTGYVGTSGTIPAEGGEVTVTLKKAEPGTAVHTNAYWKNFRGSDTNMAITDVLLPRNGDSAVCKWSKKLGSGWSASPSAQIIVDNALIVMSGTTLYKLDLQTGDILATGEMAASPSYGYVPPTYAEGMIFCPLGGGRVQAFDAATLRSLWLYTDELGGQGLSPITYADGYVYTGFWDSETKAENFVCLSVTDEEPDNGTEEKLATWKHCQSGGFYWAGSVVVGNAVIVGTDDGEEESSGDAMLYAFHKETGDIINALTLTGAGDQRSSIAYADGRIYFTTKGGFLCRVDVDGESGALTNLKMVRHPAQTTSTPIVYKGKVYYGAAGFSGTAGNIIVADSESLNMLYAVEMPGYPQCSLLLSTAYEETTGYLYFYSTYNKKPGGITVIRVDPKANTAEGAVAKQLYDAAGLEQYCVSSLICGEDGTLYYKNDSGHVIAVAALPQERVMGLIDMIGEVTPEAEARIKAARKAYDDLPESAKALVENYEVLVAAEAKLLALTGANPATGCADSPAPWAAMLLLSAATLLLAVKKKTYDGEHGM